MATNKPTLRVVGEAERAPSLGSRPPLESVFSVLDGVFGRATNDEVIEIVIQTQEEVSNRARNVSKLAADAGDRDALNEAFAFCTLADNLTRSGCLNRDKRQSDIWHRAYNAKRRVEDALAAARGRQPSPAATREPEKPVVEAFLDVAAFTDDEIIDAVCRANAVDRYGRGTVPSSSKDVVRAIAPSHNLVHLKNRAGVQMASPAALRMAQRLARLAKAGRIVRYCPKWGGANAWATAAFQPTDEFIAKKYVVRDAG